MIKNVFDKGVTEELVERIQKISADTVPQWGKMNAAQMFAHCSVAYDMAFQDNHPKVGFFQKVMLNMFVRSTVIGDKPYKKNGPTAPEFLIKEDKDFEAEQKRLIEYLEKTQSSGTDYFEGRLSRSFGHLKATEWNAMFYKHLNHHLTQFGV